MYNLLICDDDRDIRNALKIYLSGEGYKIFEAENGEEALSVASSEEIHLVLMDIMMPKMDGVSATVKLRENCNAPVIFLTAKSEDTDKILGLTAGADDYITKPFNPLEVIARVKAQLRRYAYFGGMEKKEDVISVGALELDDNAKTVVLNGEEVFLTPTEYEIMKLFIKNPVLCKLAYRCMIRAADHCRTGGDFIRSLQSHSYNPHTADVKNLFNFSKKLNCLF